MRRRVPSVRRECPGFLVRGHDFHCQKQNTVRCVTAIAAIGLSAPERAVVCGHRNWLVESGQPKSNPNSTSGSWVVFVSSPPRHDLKSHDARGEGIARRTGNRITVPIILCRTAGSSESAAGLRARQTNRGGGACEEGGTNSADVWYCRSALSISPEI